MRKCHMSGSTNGAPSPYNDKRYRENRKRLLQHEPMCAVIGCNNLATTADHIIGLDQGGDHSMENLQPMCLSCNSRKGGQYVAAKRGQRRTQPAVRTEASTRRNRPKAPARAAKPVFGDDPSTPPNPVGLSIPEVDQPLVVCEQTSVRTDLPRYETQRNGLHHLGEQVAGWSERHLKVTLMPWQKHVLEGLLSTDDEGKLLHRTGLVSVARQNGKTALIRALAGWIMTDCAKQRGQPSVLLTTAHALDLAVQLFKDVAPVLEQMGGTAKWSYGRNELEMPDGSLWLVRAATPSAGHGRSCTHIICDEVWQISSEVIDQGLLPTQTAQQQPLLAMFSTAGTESSKAMIRWREHGMRLIDTGAKGTHYFAEYSPPSDVDVINRPDLWHMANPALGHTISMETLEAFAAGPDKAAFLRSNLNMWIATANGWLPAGVWEPQRTGQPPEEFPTVVAADTSQDGDRHVAVAAWKQPDGTVIVHPAFVVGTETEKWQMLEQVAGPKTIVAITPNVDIHCPPALRNRKTIVGQSEIVKWTGLVRSMILDSRLFHCGDNMLTEHVTRAVGARTATGLVLSSSSSPGPIEMARCMVWAAALASKPVTRSKPVVVTARA